jgi:methyltransferase (TIGR00027 family)
MEGPDATAVIVALWRAAHVLVDAPPHVIKDEAGLRLANPDGDWLSQPVMGELFRPWRASIIGRARFVEDLAADGLREGVRQLVILGAGLDSLALRRADLMARLRVFEVDDPATQRWKRRRITAMGLHPPPGLVFVPVDFESGPPWTEAIAAAGFDQAAPAIIAATGVTQYLTREATVATMRLAAGLAAGSRYVSTFIMAEEILGSEERGLVSRIAARAAELGHPWISFFTPEQFVALARDAGFGDVRYVSPEELTELYFAGRGDLLRPSRASGLIVASLDADP